MVGRSSTLDLPFHAHLCLLAQRRRRVLLHYYRRRLQRGAFKSVSDLQDAIRRYIQEHNAKAARPFVWTTDPDKIIAAVKRGYQALDSDH